jgi:branched-chain amino acid transport system substrate-binding protein
MLFPFSFSFLQNNLHPLIMPARIGILLPRSSEFPSMAFDILDGVRTHLQLLNLGDSQLFTQNIGFGDDSGVVLSAAERLVMENDVQLIIAYATSLNAELLYPLADTVGRPFLFIDAGMEFFELPPNPNCFHITLQGLEACVQLARQAANAGKSVFSATSFLDGGYRSIWAFEKGLKSADATFSGHYIGHYQPAEFTLAPFTAQVSSGQSQAILASFSSYLNQLFLTKLKDEPEAARSLPFYCGPFMADEQLLKNIPFPGGTYHTVVPWATSLSNAENAEFLQTILTEKQKQANLFHLLGWEAASAAKQLLEKGAAAMPGWSYQSPRGTVTFHPETNCAYAPLSNGYIAASANGNCELQINASAEVSADDHRKLFFMKPDEGFSRWRNNYFCI